MFEQNSTNCNVILFKFRDFLKLKSFSCTETLTDTMFGIYTSFVMHTHNMCFYLQSANWQNKLDRTVDRLQDNSEEVAEKLEVIFSCILHLFVILTSASFRTVASFVIMLHFLAKPDPCILI